MGKRERAAILVCLVTLVAGCVGRKTLLAVTDGKCVTDSSSAIGAIYNLDDEYWDRSIKISDEYQCHEGTRTKLCQAPNYCYYDGLQWQEKNSLEPSPVDNLIADRRLEDFPSYLTKHVERKSQLLEYLEVARLSPKDFVLPFSLQAVHQAHIYLCKGEKVHSSPCYWFLLQGWSGTATAFRTCPANDIHETYRDTLPGKVCAASTQKFEHNRARYPKFLTGDRWSHFKIVKTGNRMLLLDADGKTLIISNLSHPLINPNHVFFHTKEVNGMWKVHEFNYLFSNQSGATRFLVGSTRGRQCISMFVAMCEVCRMEITFPSITDSPIRTFTGDNYKKRWREVKICIPSISTSELYIEIKISSVYETRSTFWAISDITIGKNNVSEWRVLTPISKAWMKKCQYFEDNSVVTLDSGLTETLDSWKKCKENEFGENCIPCGVISSSDECPRKSKYCEMTRADDGTIFNKCHCSIGYHGYSCEDVCNYKSYGHGCMRSCGKCQDGCKNDTIFGYCDEPGYCENNYSGPKCNNPPGLFIFNQPPRITPQFSTCDLEMQSFEGLGDKSSMKYYKFQYRKKGVDEWQNVTDKLNFNESKNVTLKNLTAASTYEVRVFGFGSDEYWKQQLGHVSTNIPVTNFTTKCRGLDKGQIGITPNRTSVDVYINQDEQDGCDLLNYQITVDGQPLNKARTSKSDFFKSDLRPFTNYTLLVRQNEQELFSMPFQTKEDIPGKVANFTYKLNQNNPYTVTLLWNKPETTNGVLLFYTVTVQKKPRACGDVAEEIEYFYVSPKNEEILVLSNLKPFALYSFGIKANTSAGFGESCFEKMHTNPLDRLNDKEIFHYSTPISGETNVTFLFSYDCKRLQGPVIINITLKGTNSWCNPIKNMPNEQPSSSIKVTGLTPFCDYVATLQYIRNDKVQKEGIIKFKTLQGVPHKIQDLLVTSKGPDHVSMRWLPPAPPTGDLETYQIETWPIAYDKWMGDGKLNTSDIVQPKHCDYWPQYHCATVRSIEKYYVYWLKIRAKNKGNDNFSDYEKKKFQAKEKEPGPPYGLTADWTIQNHLQLQWFHPNESNGILIGYKICANSICLEKTMTRNDYKPIYSEMIKHNLTFPETYTVSVQMRNSIAYSKKHYLSKLESPPPIPGDCVGPTHRTHNTIRIGLNCQKFQKGFTRFLYILMSECDTCEYNLQQFSNSLTMHHLVSDIKMDTSVENWRICNFRSYKNHEKGEEDFIVQNGEGQEDVVKRDTAYAFGFVWVHKHSGYIRTNYTIQNSKAVVDVASTSYVNIIMSSILLVLISVSLVLLWMRFKHRIGQSMRGLFHSESSACVIEPTYANQIELAPALEKVKHIRPKSVQISDVICPGVPTFTTTHSRRIKLDFFEQYVKAAVQNGELQQQHETFPRGQTKEWSYGILPENKGKNRYQNLIAYNHSRVVLQKIDGDEFSDYINANYIDGYRQPRAYIATQGPKEHTVSDFWRMVWQEKVSLIVMMANVIEGKKKKTEKYWPDINEQQIFGRYTVSFINSEIHANYEYRRFELQYRQAKPREVGQLHFKVWPDHGVPLYPQSLVPFLQTMLRMRNFPFVVHCSAGVGRTGTIILCDLCLRMAAAEGCVDVFAMLEHLRGQRPNMVDNVEQYKLAHLVILNCIAGMKTAIPINEDFAATVHGMGDMEKQLFYVRSCEWQDDAMKTVALVHVDEPLIVPEKNRFTNILPDQASCVFLHPYPQTSPSTSSTYINAVRVDGFCQPRRYVVTQFPLPGTIADFWRLVAEQNLSLVVCLNEIPPNDPSCKRFWPPENGEFRPVDVVHVKHIRNKDLYSSTLMTFQISTFYEYQEHQTRTVKILWYRGWKYPDLVPDPTSFLTFVEDAIAIARSSNQVLVTCFDGATASGLFIAMTFLFEKINLEQECDVCLAVRSIRSSRKQFINTKEQLEFLYKSCVLYVDDKFLQYSNMRLQ